MKETVSAKLRQRALPKKELDDMWREACGRIPGMLPNFLFQVDGDIVAVELDPQHIPARSIQEVKTPFQIEIHRKYGKNSK